MERVEQNEENEEKNERDEETVENFNQQGDEQTHLSQRTQLKIEEQSTDKRYCFYVMVVLILIALCFVVAQFYYQNGPTKDKKLPKHMQIGTFNSTKTNGQLPIKSNLQNLINLQNINSDGFHTILWLQTDDELYAKKMQIAVTAQNIIHFATLANYSVKIVNNLNAYDWLSPQMTQFIKETHQKSKVDFPVYELLRLALLIQHGGVAVRIPQLILLENLSWVQEIMNGTQKLTKDTNGSLYCRKKSPQVLIHNQFDEQGQLFFKDDFIAARKNSSLLIKILSDISAIIKNGSWPYEQFDITTIDNDTEVVSFLRISQVLINMYHRELISQNKSLCDQYGIQSFDEQNGIIMATLNDNETTSVMKNDEKSFYSLYGTRYLLRFNMNHLSPQLAYMIKTRDLSFGNGTSLVKNKIMMAFGNRWLTQRQNRTRNVHFCIISLKPQKLQYFQSQIEQQLNQLQKQTFTSWNLVNFIQKYPSTYQKINNKTTVVNASRYEGLNLQRAATKYCDPSSIGLLLDYDQSFNKVNDLEELQNQFRKKDVFGAFLRLNTSRGEVTPHARRQIRRRTNSPNKKLLQMIGNLFRAFTIQSYRFIAHFDLRHSSGRYFDRQIPFLSMLQIAQHFKPCESGNIVYQVRRLQQFMTLPKRKVFFKVFINTNTIRKIDINKYQYFGKLRYRHLCGTIQFYQNFVAPIQTMVVLNNGYEQQGLEARRGLPELIPRKIHQIWVQGSIPAFKQLLMNRLRDSHPNYQYFFWSKQNITQSNFPQSYDLLIRLLQWDNDSPYSKMAAISDIMRCQIIYNHGGFYLDTNYMLFKNNSLDQFLSYTFVTSGELSQRQRFFRDNAIFGAVKYSPRIKRIISHKALSSRNVYSKWAAKETGPGLFGKTLLGIQEQDSDVFQPAFQEFYPNFNYDQGNFNKNRCEAKSQTPQKDILFKSSRSYLKNCGQIYSYAIGLDFFSEGLSWIKKKW